MERDIWHSPLTFAQQWLILVGLTNHQHQRKCHKVSFIQPTKKTENISNQKSTTNKYNSEKWRLFYSASMLDDTDDKSDDTDDNTRQVYLMLQPRQSTDPQVLSALPGLVRLVIFNTLLHLLDLFMVNFTEHQLLRQSSRRNRRHQLTRHTHQWHIVTVCLFLCLRNTLTYLLTYLHRSHSTLPFPALANDTSRLHLCQLTRSHIFPKKTH